MLPFIRLMTLPERSHMFPVDSVHLRFGERKRESGVACCLYDCLSNHWDAYCLWFIFLALVSKYVAGEKRGKKGNSIAHILTLRFSRQRWHRALGETETLSFCDKRQTNKRPSVPRRGFSGQMHFSTRNGTVWPEGCRDRGQRNSTLGRAHEHVSVTYPPLGLAIGKEFHPGNGGERTAVVCVPNAFAYETPVLRGVAHSAQVSCKGNFQTGYGTTSLSQTGAEHWHNPSKVDVLHRRRSDTVLVLWCSRKQDLLIVERNWQMCFPLFMPGERVQRNPSVVPRP